MADNQKRCKRTSNGTCNCPDAMAASPHPCKLKQAVTSKRSMHQATVDSRMRGDQGNSHGPASIVGTDIRMQAHTRNILSASVALLVFNLYRNHETEAIAGDQICAVFANNPNGCKMAKCVRYAGRDIKLPSDMQSRISRLVRKISICNVFRMVCSPLTMFV